MVAGLVSDVVEEEVAAGASYFIEDGAAAGCFYFVFVPMVIMSCRVGWPVPFTEVACSPL